jgi:conjugative relaxase-like TrwC/TraI family protein
VLSIAKLVARAEDYYLRTVAAGREEYYTGAGESPGYWLGQGARLLGLSGEVAPQHLRAVLAGASPHGEILTPGGVTTARRVAGFDLTFSAPKSVSLLYGLSEREVSATVRAVHADAVSQALDYLERRAFFARRGHGGLRRIGAQGLLGAAFVHRTSRAGDPQLHTHVLVANVAMGDDGAWSAPDGRLIYVHTRTAGFVYQAALRAGLGKALGVRFGPATRGMAELEGVPKRALRAFSTRRLEIEALMAATGVHTPRAAEAAALVTRSPKDLAAVSGPGLRERWLARAAALGLEAPRPERGVLDHLLGVERWVPPSATEVRGVLARLVGPEGLTASSSTFERRDVVRGVAEQLPRGATVRDVEAIAERVLVVPDVVTLPSLGRGAEVRHTTHELLALERLLLDAATGLRHARRAVAEAGSLASALGHFPLLSAEQVAMVERLATSGAGVEVVVGKAGAGKTLALAAARLAWEGSGSRVFGTALSARAARGLADGAGISSDTLARVLAGVGSGSLRLGPADVVVLDEAGMVGTRDLATLLAATERAGSKLVLVGDPRQLPEIEAGGALAALVKRVGAIDLTENRRQREPWERLALDALRLGRAEVALATYERAGRVYSAPDMAEARRELVERWAESYSAGHDAVMLAAGRAEVAALNEAARATLRRSGNLGADVLEVGEWGFAVGDKVVCLRNDRRIGIVNGTTGTVERAIGAGLAIGTTEGPRLLPEAYLEAGHLGHAYALTIHKAQGLTVERAYVLAGESLTQESGYVAMSRARDVTEIFVPLVTAGDTAHDPRPIGAPDPLAEVRRRLGSSRAKHLATDELDGEPLNDEGTERRVGNGRAGGELDQGEVPAGAVYRSRQATRGVGEGGAMGADQRLNAGTGSNLLVAEAIRAALDAQRRLAAEIAGRGSVRELEPPGRSRGRGR